MPEDVHPTDVVQEERVEEERRYEAFVADEADGRSRSGPAGVRRRPRITDARGRWPS